MAWQDGVRTGCSTPGELTLNGDSPTTIFESTATHDNHKSHERQDTRAMPDKHIEIRGKEHWITGKSIWQACKRRPVHKGNASIQTSLEIYGSLEGPITCTDNPFVMNGEEARGKLN